LIGAADGTATAGCSKTFTFAGFPAGTSAGVLVKQAAIIPTASAKTKAITEAITIAFLTVKFGRVMVSITRLRRSPAKQ
jgi:hypothetical protein